MEGMKAFLYCSTLWVVILLLITPCYVSAAALEMNGDVAVTGALSATTFSGSGAGLSNIPGSAISGTSITAGQLADGAVTPVKIGFLGKVAIVATVGGDYSNPATAMADYASWCGTPSATNPCLLKIMPGIYDLGSGSLTMQQYVDIEGSGENVTVINGTVSNGSYPLLSGVVNGSNNAEIRFLTVRNTGTGSYIAAMLNSGGFSPRMTHMTAEASGGTRNFGVLNYGSSSPAMSNVTATASGGSYSYGVYNDTSSSPAMNNVTASTSGGTRNYGVYNASSSPAMNSVTATASGGSYTYGVYNYSSSPTMTNVTATATGGTSSYGVYNYSSSTPTMSNVTATGTGGTNNYGMYNDASSGSNFYIKIDRSTFSGSTNSIYGNSRFILMIGASKLTGGAAHGSLFQCIGDYDGATYLALDNYCQP